MSKGNTDGDDGEPRGWYPLISKDAGDIDRVMRGNSSGMWSLSATGGESAVLAEPSRGRSPKELPGPGNFNPLRKGRWIPHAAGWAH